MEFILTPIPFTVINDFMCEKDPMIKIIKFKTIIVCTLEPTVSYIELTHRITKLVLYFENSDRILTSTKNLKYTINDT